MRHPYEFADERAEKREAVLKDRVCGLDVVAILFEKRSGLRHDLIVTLLLVPVLGFGCVALTEFLRLKKCTALKGSVSGSSIAKAMATRVIKTNKVRTLNPSPKRFDFGWRFSLKVIIRKLNGNLHTAK